MCLSNSSLVMFHSHFLHLSCLPRFVFDHVFSMSLAQWETFKVEFPFALLGETTKLLGFGEEMYGP